MLHSSSSPDNLMKLFMTSNQFWLSVILAPEQNMQFFSVNTDICPQSSNYSPFAMR